MGTQTNKHKHRRHPPGKNYSPRLNLFCWGQKCVANLQTDQQMDGRTDPDIVTCPRLKIVLVLKNCPKKIVLVLKNCLFWKKLSSKQLSSQTKLSSPKNDLTPKKTCPSLKKSSKSQKIVLVQKKRQSEKIVKSEKIV